MSLFSTKNISTKKPHLRNILGIFAILLVGSILLLMAKISLVGANWMWGNFLNQDFWNQQANTGNILYATFGDGTPGSTPYTRLWTTSCIPNNVQVLPSSFVGGSLQANTIYLINSGTYTLTTPLSLTGCSALLGRGNVRIKTSPTNYITLTATSKIIIDAILLDGQSLANSGIVVSGSQNITFHATEFIQYTGQGPLITNSTRILLDSASFYNNHVGISFFPLTGQSLIINNTKFYNNTLGLLLGGFVASGAQRVPNTKGQVSINNSQFFNNGGAFSGAHLPTNNGGGMTVASSGSTINNTIFYNNTVGFRLYDTFAHINTTQTYNNGTGWELLYSGALSLYGNHVFYNNTSDIFAASGASINNTTNSSLGWTLGIIDTGAALAMNYDRVTNPQDTNGISLLNGTNRNVLRGPLSWTSLPTTRYLFGLFIPHQIAPITQFSGALSNYGILGQEYDTNKYVTELDPPFTTAQMSIINQYFGSGSLYTQNWESNPCSPASFQVIELDPNALNGNTYILQDHTLYFLTGGTFTFSATHGFVFGGNCIALIGNDTSKIEKDTSSAQSLLYADNKHHLIIDNLRLDGYFYGGGNAIAPASMGIQFDNYTNNTTINHVQAYNMQQYGIFLGVGAHHNSIINSQTYNNKEAGMYLYLASNYNVINNAQSYNNSGYGIWFANGSHNNAMNNFQAYNNHVGVFADLTTSSNIINRAMLYNNSEYGLLLKNSSGNILNDIKIYNNAVGIKSLFNATNNKFLGQLSLFDNLSGDFEGTDGNDTSLKAGSAFSFFSGGSLTLGAGLMGCSYVTNPTLSGTSIGLLDTANCDATGANFSVFSGLVWDIGYLFGANIYKQSRPFYYTSGSIISQTNNQYDSGKYIAEVFPIRDSTPENFSFASVSNFALSTGYTTNIYTAGIINTTVPVSLQIQGSTGHLIINGASLTGAGYMQNGDTLQVYLLSSSGFSQVISGIVTLGSTTTSFTVTSRGPRETPTSGSFFFSPITGASINTFVSSASSLIQGIETGVIANFASLSSGRLEVYSTGNQFISSGATGLVFSGSRVKIIVKSSPNYQEITTGTLSIGTGSGNFIVQTLPDIIPPEVSFIDAVSASGYRSDSVSILFTGANVFSGYGFVSAPHECTGTMTLSGFLPYTTGIVLTGPNNYYLCAYAKDIGNNITTKVSDYPLHISNLVFEDGVSSIPVSYDPISIGNSYLLHKKYALVSTGSQCNSGGAAFQDYTGSFTASNAFVYNGKYLCAYGEDTSGSGRYLLSSVPFNIDLTLPSIIFTDPVNSGSALSDTISVQAIGGFYTQLGYKYVSAPADCSSTGTVPYTGAITLQTEQYNGKYFCAYIAFSGYQLPLVSAYPIAIDRSAPSVPTVIAPRNQESSFFLILEVSGSMDSGAGISGYTYTIAQDPSFLDIVYTGQISSGIRLFSPPREEFDAITGTYYRAIRATDLLGNTSNRGTGGSFVLNDDESFSFDEEIDADTDTDYESSALTIAGLRSGSLVRASINNGDLLKNQRKKGSGVFVQNGDVLSIRLTSSADEGKSVSSTLSIANRITKYRITTRDNTSDSCSLSSTDKKAIQLIFDNLIIQYQGDQTKYAEFLATMKSMLQDKIDITNDCNLKYLSDLVSQGLDQGTIDTQAHTAPNCKSYIVSYSTGKLAYTSPSLKNIIYFATRDALTRFIDSKNPGDCHINTYTTTTSIFANTDPSRHVAPNGKIYTINTTTSNGYTSPELSKVRYFSSITALRSYLDSNNPPQKVWNHVVDKTFSPLTYLAPNGKEYSIYKTDRGYMSYKLMQVKYFSTLDSIKSYIIRNNSK